ncbi:MAG: fibronectin type III domain-containing protein [Bacteroidales bacterium]|nr:fibronectin type III domain-containing protein [Bacteroidales bacterium]
MKKVLLFIVAILTLGLASVPVSAQNTLLVADGNETNSYVPIYGYYADAYLRAQIIYPDSMLTVMQNNAISEMTFYFSSSPSSWGSATFDVKVGTTTATSLSGFSSDPLLTVYSGAMTIANGQMTVEFDVPFNYTGGNLLVEFATVNQGDYSSASFLGINSTGSSVQGYSYSSVSDVSPSARNFIPKTTFSYGTPSLCIKPLNVTLEAASPYGATISWLGGDNDSYYNFEYMLASQSDWTNAQTLTAYDTVIDITGLQPATTYKARVQTSCSDNTLTNWSTEIYFTTPNIPITLPYTQDFETSPESITDFTLLSNNTNSWIIGSSVFNPGSDGATTGHSLYISDDNSSYAYSYGSYESWYSYAVMDVDFPADAQEWHLVFDYKVEGYSYLPQYYGLNYSDVFSVYLVDATTSIPTDAMPTGTALLDAVTGVTSWTHFDAILDNVAGQSKKIVFVWKNYTYSYDDYDPAAVDNISIQGFSCAQPNQLSVSAVTEDGATLSWHEVGSATSWTVYYKPANDSVYTDISVTDTFYTLTGLSADTYYEFYVTSDCSGETSNPSAHYSFKTQCGAVSQLPYTAGFDEYIMDGGSEYIDCWSRLASDPAHYVYHMSGYSHSGAGCLDFHYTPNCYNIAIMPAIDATIPVNTLMVEFYLDKTGSSGVFEVGVMSDPSDATTFEVVDTVTSTISGNGSQYYEYQIVSLGSYAGTGQHIAFRVSNAVECGYRLDDVTVSEIPSCMHPTNLHSTSVGSNSVGLGWTEMGDATAWNIIYGPTGFDPETAGTLVAADATTYTVDNLSTITAYDFYVQADCGGMTSPWEGPISVTTGTYTMSVTGTDSLTTCGVVIYDNGGPNGDYSVDCNSTLILYPETPGSMMMISGSSNTESSYDHLYIYDGAGTTGTQLCDFSGTHNNFTFISTTGPLTIRFTSDYTVVYPGFELTAQCADCLPPTNVVVTNPTLDGATISWSGSADSYSVCVYGPDTTYLTTTDTTVTLTNLTSSSTYQVRLRSMCYGDSSMLTAPVTFNTSCGALTITATEPWTENFEGYTGGGAQSFICWATPVTESVDNGTSPFVYCGHAPACHSGQNSAEFKGNHNMAVLPEFTNDIHELRLSFWATTTNTSSYGTMEIGVMTDVNDTSTFELLGLAGVPGARGSSGSGHGNYMGPFDFNGVTATTGRIALRFTGYSGLSWNIDDIVVELTPSCPSPVKTSVEATNVDGHNATITFVDNDVTHDSWTVYYKPSTDSVWNSLITSSTTVDLTGLDPQTTYDVYVVTNCATPDLVEDATQTIQFTTTVACPAPQNLTVSAIGMTSATVTWFSNADGFTIEYGPQGFTPGEGTTATTTSATYDLTGLTSGTAYTVYVTADCGTDGSSTAASANFNTSLCDTADQCAYIFTLNDSYGDGWNGGSLAVQQNGITVATLSLTGGSSATETVYLCDNDSTSLVWTSGSYAYEASFSVVGPDGLQLYAASDMSTYSTYTFISSCTIPTCAAPTSIAVANIGTTSADISWVAGGTETNWNLEYKETTATTWTVIPVTTNPYTLTGLTAMTAYDVRVQADCGGGDVSYYVETSFNTANCDVADQCTYTFNLNDEYGDGWNGGSLAVQQNGITVATVTLDYGESSGTQAVTLCDNISTSLVWTEGGYDNEASFNLVGPDGTMLYVASDMSLYTTYTFITDCDGGGTTTCAVPTALAVNNISQTAATATWTAGGTETTWNVAYKAVDATNWETIQVTVSTFTMNGLTASTNYQVRVQAVCDANVTSDWTTDVNFTTLGNDTPTCPAPTNLAATVDHTDVTLTWHQEANTASEWQINYRQTTESNWSTVTATTTSYTLTDLVANVTYEANVVAHCSNGLNSDPSNTVTFETNNNGVQTYLEKSVNLYPNPATEMVSVAVSDANIAITSVEVYNVYGQLINVIESNDNPLRINVSGMADGMYYVRVTTDNGVVTKNFVKR